MVSKSGLIVRGDHIWIGEGHIRHHKEDFILHILDRLNRDHKLTIGKIAREYLIDPLRLYQFMRDNGVDAESIQEMREWK